MKVCKKWRALSLTVGMAMLISSCAVHRRPRPPRHHPHHHRVVVIAGQTTAAEQSEDCIIFEECLAATEPDSYGSTE